MIDLSGTFIGFPQFLSYFALGLALLAAFMWIYTLVTPYDERALVRQNNAAAAISWIGAMIGYALPMSSALRESFALQEFLVWGVIAGLAQILVFFGYRYFYPRLTERIEQGELATAINLAGVSVAVGIMNAAAIVE